jgi:hypothetical protein
MVSSSVLIGTAGCSREVHQTRRSVSGAIDERIAAVEKLIRKSNKSDELPGEILDARLHEIQFGDNRLGPADYHSYVWLQVKPEDVPAWENAMTPTDAPLRTTSVRPPDWWKAGFEPGVVRFSPHALFGRSNGWVVLQEDGQIFAFTYTQ